MTAPALIEHTAATIARLLANPKVRAVCDQWFEAVRTDLSMRAEVEKFLDAW